jgi:hypothetical protein
MPTEKDFDWGGARKNAGRPRGASKVKISVSVNEKNWRSALKSWDGTASGLIDKLIADHVKP